MIKSRSSYFFTEGCQGEAGQFDVLLGKGETDDGDTQDDGPEEVVQGNPYTAQEEP
jgi:hypothetical protein